MAGVAGKSGRKPLNQDQKLLKKFNAFNPMWWRTLREFANSEDLGLRKFAMTEYNKLQTKKIPQDITTGGDKLEFYDKDQVRRIAERSLRNGEGSSK